MLCCASRWQYWRQSLERWMCEINRANRLAQACVHFVTDHNCSLSSCSPIHNVFQRTFQHGLPCHWTTPLLLRKVYPTLVIFALPQQTYGIRTSLWIFPHILHSVCVHAGVHSKYTWSRWCWFVQINVLLQFLPHGSHYYTSFLTFYVIYENRTE